MYLCNLARQQDKLTEDDTFGVETCRCLIIFILFIIIVPSLVELQIKKNMSLKNPVTPPGIDPGTMRLVAQRLNHYATPVFSGKMSNYSKTWCHRNSNNFTTLETNSPLYSLEMFLHRRYYWHSHRPDTPTVPITLTEGSVWYCTRNKQSSCDGLTNQSPDGALLSGKG